MPHYTSNSQDAFVEKITADFIGQIAQRLEESETSQVELARKLGKSESDVSQVLNLNRMNLTLKTMVGFARALGMKLAVVAYDDGDPFNERGPVGSQIFNLSWGKIGKPRDIWSIKNFSNANVCYLYSFNEWRGGSVTVTVPGFGSGLGATRTFSHITDWPSMPIEKATNARSQELRI